MGRCQKMSHKETGATLRKRPPDTPPVDVPQRGGFYVRKDSQRVIDANVKFEAALAS